MDLSWTSIILIVLILVYQNTPSFGDGTITIRLMKFINPGGKGANGHCCDGRGIFCQRNGCDHKFTICFDDNDRSREFGHCSFGKYQTKRIKNTNIIDFTGDIGSVSNPIIIQILGAPLPNITLKVNVYDDDYLFGNDDDFVDYLEVKNITHVSGRKIQLLARARTLLTFSVAAACDKNWHGDICDTQCEPNTNHRYTCDPTTGEKVCHDGWMGVNCDEVKSSFIDRPDADCDRLLTQGGVTSSGRYDIHVGDHDPFPVYCAVTSDGLGWTVIQRRAGQLLNFSRGWEDYKDGFGSLDGSEDFWLGLEKMHCLTTQRRYKLRVVMEVGDLQGTLTPIYAEYDHFTVGSEAEKYALHIEAYSGTAENSLSFSGFGGTRNHQSMPFSTQDRDNDKWPDGNCAQVYGSGWWYNDCYWANLNGKAKCSGGNCLSWHAYLLYYTRMRLFI